MRSVAPICIERTNHMQTKHRHLGCLPYEVCQVTHKILHTERTGEEAAAYNRLLYDSQTRDRSVRRHVAGHGAAARGRRAGGNGPCGVGSAWPTRDAPATLSPPFSAFKGRDTPLGLASFGIDPSQSLGPKGTFLATLTFGCSGAGGNGGALTGPAWQGTSQRLDASPESFSS